MEKMERPKVSVIMTTFQAERYLKQSIESVLNQSMQEIELLCIDGHSTDQTVEIIERCRAKDARVRLYEQERKGIGAAKNCGIEKAVGKYITFLDADDYYVDNHALEIMYQACEKNNVTVCGALRTMLHLDGTITDEPLHRHDLKGRKAGVLLKYQERQYDYHFHSYLYRRSMILESDARFAEVSAYDDTHFFIRAMLQAKKFYVVPVELYRYRCGCAYDWGSEKAKDALDALTDQLRLTAKNHLEMLHWLTVQRINYEYGEIFIKNIRNGNIDLLEKLARANAYIDSNMIEKIEKMHKPEKWYVEPMMHRNIDDMPLRNIEESVEKKYILEPIWRLLHFEEMENMEQQSKIASLQDEIYLLKRSYTFKIGSMILYLPRKIMQILKQRDK